MSSATAHKTAPVGSASEQPPQAGKSEPTLIQKMLAERRAAGDQRQTHEHAPTSPTAAVPTRQLTSSWTGNTSPLSSTVPPGRGAAEPTLIQKMLAQRRSWEGSSPLDSPAGSPHIAPTSPASSSPVAAISLPRHLSPPPASGEIGLSFGDIPRSHSDGEVGVSGTRGTSEDNVSLTSAGSSEEWSSEESGRSPRNQRGGGSPLATKADLTRSLIWHARPDMTEYHPQHAPARVPEDEDERLDVLYQHGLQRVPLQDPELVNFAEIARRMCDTEAAYISVLESEREYVLARAGTWQLHEVDREIAFGAHAVLDSDALVVPDASRDERFKYNKLVYATTNTRFLAAAPLKVMRLGREFRLGCLCVADEGARETFGAGEVLLLETLAEAVVRHIELRPREADLDTSYSRQVMVVKGFVASAGVNLSEENIYKLARCLTIRSVPSKQYLTRKGDPGNVMYIISKGSAACLVKKVEIERLSKGMCFGEVAIMNMCKMRAAGISEEAIARRCVRMADVRALEPCELCALTLDDAWPLIREIPELWVAFEEIAQRRAIRAAVPQLASGKLVESAFTAGALQKERMQTLPGFSPDVKLHERVSHLPAGHCTPDSAFSSSPTVRPLFDGSQPPNMRYTQASAISLGLVSPPEPAPSPGS